MNLYPNVFRPYYFFYNQSFCNSGSDHCENQTEDEAVAEDEVAWEDTSHTFIEVPNELVPAVRELIAKKVA